MSTPEAGLPIRDEHNLHIRQFDLPASGDLCAEEGIATRPSVCHLRALSPLNCRDHFGSLAYPFSSPSPCLEYTSAPSVNGIQSREPVRTKKASAQAGTC